ncbi:MAG TPA: serine hydrolase [Terriglobia bacterium]|nr:serine hydrolase [Terriglobia bacterium]
MITLPTKRIIIGLSLMLGLHLGARGQDYFPPPDAAGGWRTLNDPAQIRKVAGMDVRRLDEAFEYTERTTQHGGLLVLRHGWLVYERYFGKGNREADPQIASVSKAFSSIACGIMLKEKHDLIPQGLDTKVFTEKYLPEAFPLDDPRKADIKLGHLLTMAAGFHEESDVAYVDGHQQILEPAPPRAPDQDLGALHAPMWCAPGEGYCYSSAGVHVATIVLRHLTGMEMEEYINQRLAKPMQWGRWGYARRWEDGTPIAHTPGGFGIALHSTDALRFGYLLLHQGRWGTQQLVPADYINLCRRPSPYDPHAPFSLQFEVNADGHILGAPRDVFLKSGAGGFSLIMVPSLDMVIYKMGSMPSYNQYDPAVTGLPLTYAYDGSRDTWKPLPHDEFYEGPITTDDGVHRVIAMVVAAIVECP